MLAAEPTALLDAASFRMFVADWPLFYRWMLERLRTYDGAVVCRAGHRLAIAGFVPGAGDLVALHQPDLDDHLLRRLGFSREERHPFSGDWWTLAVPPPAARNYRDISGLPRPWVRPHHALCGGPSGGWCPYQPADLTFPGTAFS